MEWKWTRPAVSFVRCSEIGACARPHWEAKQLGTAMLTSSILVPLDCTAQALAEFEKLVVEGGAVNPQGLEQRIRNASRLLFLRASDGQLLGVGALKHPRPTYRNRVFADARATVPADGYPVELGWVVVAKSHQGLRLSTRIVGELLPFAKKENVFATTRADQRVMSFASDYGFEINGKPYPSGHGYDLALYLRNATRSSLACGTETPMRRRMQSATP
jgi:GNAT superfamily N-acetyltransferase